jgi:Glycosyltransferase family 87
MHPITVWIAFVLAHLWLGLLNLYAPGLPLGDVTIVYKFWMDQALIANYWVGIDSAWVYPVLALVPMLMATLFGPDQFASTWLTMVMILNAIAFGFVTDWGRARDRVSVGWWWVAFLVLLGPIALARIDSVTVALAIVGSMLLARRPGAAGVVLAIATWIKVWPVAIVLAAVIALRDRLRVIASMLIVSAVVLVSALVIGSGGNVLSFITQQTGRGLQIESPVSTLWLWRIVAGEPNTFIYYDRDILTYQIYGSGVEVAAAAMTPLLAIVVAVITVFGMRAVRRGATPGDLLAPLALALVVALIAFNKVGSPQFVSWLAVPAILGLVASKAGLGPSFRTPAILALVIAALTQIVYPYLYSWLLVANPVMVGVLTIRNGLYFVLLCWAVLTMARAKDAPGIRTELVA